MARKSYNICSIYVHESARVVLKIYSLKMICLQVGGIYIHDDIYINEI